MRTIKKLVVRIMMVNAIITALAFGTIIFAQNYKASKIDAEGKITDGDGIHIGWVTKEGIVKDAQGKKVAFIDSEGNLVSSDGKKLGKADKNGNYYDVNGALITKTGKSQGELCNIEDKNGKVVASVHNSYKNQACAIHCLSKK